MHRRQALLLLMGSALLLGITFALPVSWSKYVSAHHPQHLLPRRAGHDELSLSILDKRQLPSKAENIVQRRSLNAGELATSKASSSPSSSSKASEQQRNWSLLMGRKKAPHSMTTSELPHEEHLSSLPPPKKGEKLLGNFLYGKDWKPTRKRKSFLAKFHFHAQKQRSPPSPSTSLLNPPGHELKNVQKGKAVEVAESSSSHASNVSKKDKKVQFRSASKLNVIIDLPAEPVIERKKSASSKTLNWTRGGNASKVDTIGKAKKESKTSSPPRPEGASTLGAYPSSESSNVRDATSKKKDWNHLSILKKKKPSTSPQFEKTDSFIAKEYLRAHEAEVSFKSPPYDTKIEKSPEEEAQIAARIQRINSEMHNERKAKSKKMFPFLYYARQKDVATAIV